MNALSKAREDYIDEITEVAARALREAGFSVPHGDSLWQELRDVIAPRLRLS